MDINSLMWLLDKIEKWLNRSKMKKREEKKRLDEAISALLKALNETEIYLGRIQNEKDRIGRNCEEELSRLWMAAAEAIREVDSALASACFDKSQHWAKSEEWRSQRDETENAHIRIKTIAQQAKELMST